MRVIEYKAHNVLRLSDIKFDMEGRNLFLVGGKNGQGKTSALNGLLMALCGRSGMDYPEPALREGEKSGWISVKLSSEDVPELMEDDHITVQLEFERRRSGTVKERFRIIDSTGEEAPEPRKLLKRLYQNKAFDPLAFDRLTKKERREVLMKLLGLDLEQYRKDHKTAYDRRTQANRDAEKAQARLDAMPYFEDAPDDPVLVAALMDQVEAIQSRNTEIHSAERKMDMATKSLSGATSRVEDLKRQLKEAELLLKEAIKTEKAAIADREKLGEVQDTEELTAKIRDAGEVNMKVQANANRIDVAMEVEKADRIAEDCDDAVKKLQEDQDKDLQKAKWPVPGMSIDDEGVLLDGLPLESACKSARVIASTKVGMSLHPKLKLLVCEDGSDLDSETLAELDKVLKKEDFQMLVELVTRTAEDEEMCAVIISDGKIRKEEPEPAEIT